MDSATSIPLAALRNLGGFKAGGLQVHTVRQVATIYGPNLVGRDGDLTLDTGDVTRAGNGRLRVRGGVQGFEKADVLQAGVWDRDLDIGTMSGTSISATTVGEHISAGTLLTGLRIPTIGGASLSPRKMYALRSIGTQGHIAWGRVSDLPDDLNVDGVLSTSGSASVTGKMFVGESGIINGATVLGDTLSVAGNVVIEEALSVGARFDLDSQLRVGGIAVMASSLSVASTGVFGDTLSVASGLTAERAKIGQWLSVGQIATFASHVSVGHSVTLDDLHVRGTVAPIRNGLSVSGDIVIADGLSIAAGLTLQGILSVGTAFDLSGNRFDCRTAHVTIGTDNGSSAIALRGSAVDVTASLRVGGALFDSCHAIIDHPFAVGFHRHALAPGGMVLVPTESFFGTDSASVSEDTTRHVAAWLQEH